MTARSHTGRSRVTFNSGPRSPSRRTKNKVSFYEFVAYEKSPLFFLKKHQPAAVLTPICYYICQNTRAITSVIQVKTATYAEKMAARFADLTSGGCFTHTNSAYEILIHSMSPSWQGIWVLQRAFITQRTVIRIKIIRLLHFEKNLGLSLPPFRASRHL